MNNMYLLRTNIKDNTIITLTKFNIDTILLSTNGSLDFFFPVQNPIKVHALHLVSYLFSFI